MKIFDALQTEELLPFEQLVDALEAGFRTGCVVPVRHHHNIEKKNEADATLLLMPAWSNPGDRSQYLGVKLVTVVPGNSSRGLPGLTSTYVLYDNVTGQQLAIMDGNTITGRRTVATSALAARYLSRADASSLCIVGAGRVASLLADAYRAVRQIEEIVVWDISAENARLLAETLRGKGMKASASTDLERAVSTADIVSSATLATEPLIRGEWIRPGTHIDLIGGFTPAMREADDDAIMMARAYVDTPEALHEAGDLVQPINSTLIAEDHLLGTLADLVRGTVPGRQSSSEVTFFKAVGSALADLVAARHVFEKNDG